MLKNLLSTLIETVFTNKKSFIATQCLPSWSNTLQTFTEQQGSTVVPHDGWARIQSHCNSLQASIVQTCLVTVSNQNDTWPSIVFPVKKGEYIHWNVSENFQGEVSVWFIHNQTNE